MFKYLALISLFFINSSFALYKIPTTPYPGEAQSIGGYASGCFIGGQALGVNEDGLQQMRLSRGRFWGLPAMLDFLRQAGASVKTELNRDLLIGDICHARGGPALTGHVSHQNGLDVDIWFKTIESSNESLSLGQRETISAYSVLIGKLGLNQKLWTERDRKILEILISDERVQRIFVNPVIKKDLCENAQLDEVTLRKIRPWYGHDDHYHVRLHCPESDKNCIAQQDPPEVDTCKEELTWWLEEMVRDDGAVPEPGRDPQEEYNRRLQALPKLCKEILGINKRK